MLSTILQIKRSSLVAITIALCATLTCTKDVPPHTKLKDAIPEFNSPLNMMCWCVATKHVDIPGFTKSYPSMKIQCILDYFLFPKNAQHLISDCKIVPNILSVYFFVICLLRHGPPRLAFASCGHALSVNRSRKIKEKVLKCLWNEIFAYFFIL